MRKRPYLPFYDSALVKDKRKPIAAFDTETLGLGGKLLLITYAYETLSDGVTTIASGIIDSIIDGNNEQDMILQLLAIMRQADTDHGSHTWYAHNAQYDWRYFMSHLRDKKLRHTINMRNDNDIYQITIFPNEDNNKNRIVMRDSLAIWQGTLKSLLEQYAPDLPKLTIDNIAAFDPINPAHRNYALRDAIGLTVAVGNLDAMMRDQYGTGLRGTTASTAMAAWERQITQRYWMNETNEDYIRKAYFGGMVFLTRDDIVTNAKTYDINSSYPYQMRAHTFPYGNIFRTDQYQPDMLGIYTVKLYADPNKILLPCIPKRLATGRMVWPTGTFETTITNVELEYAVSQGYTLIDISDGVTFEETVAPFAPFITKCEAIRFSFKGKPQEKLAKLMQNSLYGKFGSRRERVEMFVPSDDDDIIDARPWDVDQYWFIRTVRQELRCIPHWSIFTTAYARLHLHQTVMHLGIENVIYGDTDSITVTSAANQSLIDVGPLYGQWKLEKEWQHFRAIAPKTYAGILRSGIYAGAAKGMPEKVMKHNWQALFNNGVTDVAYDTLPSLKSNLKTGMMHPHRATRTSSLLDNSVGWERGNGNQIRARVAQ